MRRILNSLSTPTAKSTLAFYIASFTQSIFRYLFHLVLLRLLLPAEYGEFLSYLSLIYLLGIPMSTVSTVVTKYVSEYHAKKKSKEINLFFYFLLKTLSPLVLTVGLALFLFSGPLSVIFKAHPIAFTVLGISMFVSLFQTIITSYIIAFQEFVYVSAIGFLSIFLTIALSFIFIRSGLGATGAVIGQLVSNIICTIINFVHLRSRIFPKADTKIKPNFSMGGFTIYSFLYSLGTLSLISTDILVVRAFSEPHLSGLYSALSILGRMILFGLTPIISLTLPIASNRHAASGTAKPVFIKLGGLITFLGFVGAGIFSLFPELVVKILSGGAYLAISPYLSIFAFSMVFFAVSQFILSYLMATGFPKANFILVSASVVQPIIIYFFRNSLSGIIWSSFLVQLFLACSLLLYLFRSQQTKQSA